MDVRFCESRNHCREAHICGLQILNMSVLARSSVARVRRTVFSLDNDLHGSRQTVDVTRVAAQVQIAPE
jgi:hypothetical protein